LSYQPIDNDTTRATANLPGLDVEIIHRRSRDGDAEQISINLQAEPSFEAFGRYLETVNPFAFWGRAVQLAWFPWLGTASALMPFWSATQAQLNPPDSEGSSKDV
jgi:hypothetical protein